MTKKSAWNKVGKRQNKNGEVEKMARKDDILSIYTKEVEGTKKPGFSKERHLLYPRREQE